MSDIKALGKEGEMQAVRFLKNLGYEILAQNQKTPYGEIDIIALHNKELVAIEVKTRTSTAFGRPSEAVNSKKLSHLSNALEFYRQGKHKLPEAIRIDVVEVYSGKTNNFNLIARVDQF